MSAGCNSPIAFPTLIEYWLGELGAHEERALEEHFFGCGHCAARLEELARLAAGIRAVFRAGGIHAVISRGFLDYMNKENLRFREYRLGPGESVQCTLGADDDAVVGRLRAPLEGVRRLDLVNIEAGHELRLADIPFDPAAGEVLFCPSAAKLRKLPAHTSRVRLIAVDDSGERALGEYTFKHTPL